MGLHCGQGLPPAACCHPISFACSPNVSLARSARPCTTRCFGLPFRRRERHEGRVPEPTLHRCEQRREVARDRCGAAVQHKLHGARAHRPDDHGRVGGRSCTDRPGGRPGARAAPSPEAAAAIAAQAKKKTARRSPLDRGAEWARTGRPEDGGPEDR